MYAGRSSAQHPSRAAAEEIGWSRCGPRLVQVIGQERQPVARVLDVTSRLVDTFTHNAAFLSLITMVFTVYKVCYSL